jgi:predicted nucleic acid-binding protein
LIVLVIDASAALQASLPSDGFAFLDQEELVAPALLWSEVPSVLHEMAWRGTVSRDLGRAALDRFLAAPIGARRHTRLTPEAWRIADDLGWAKTYDAEYVALAHLLSSRLLTLDARLRRTASRLVEVLGPTEL